MEHFQKHLYIIEVKKELLEKMRVLAKINGRTVDDEFEFLFKQSIAAFEKEHGRIDTSKDADETL